MKFQRDLFETKTEDVWTRFRAKKARKKRGKDAASVFLDMSIINRANLNMRNGHIIPAWLALKPIMSGINASHISLRGDIQIYLPELLKF